MADLLDLMVERIPFLKSYEKILFRGKLEGEAELSAISPGGLERILNRSLRGRFFNKADLREKAEQDAALLSMRAIACVSYYEVSYPPLLREIYDPPFLVFCRGRLPRPEKPLVAVVGTRKPSPRALAETFEICRGLARCGIPVVSGLALGIDAMAHRGNLEGGGETVAVLGSSPDEVYPASNRTLARRIVERGGALLSEYPPGTGPRPYHFPARNRIISALARGVLIVEAPLGSGALITAQFALEQGKDLWVGSAGARERGSFAVLGAGTAKLADEGAKIVARAGDILAEWGIKEPVEADTGNVHNEEAVFSGKGLASSLAKSLNIEL
ncbi:MAG: DNA-processing protein DprA [Treponema sp.]|jgi:DNA processing protein|nr:DNA-processing protein DprA [Treponema sp.]